MKLRYPITLSVLFCLALSPAAFGQTSPRIAVANTGRILSEMQEYKVFREDLESDTTLLRSSDKEKQEELVKLNRQRQEVRSNTPQRDDLDEKYADAVGSYKLWLQQETLKLQRKQQRKVRELISRIEKAIGEVAQRDGYDLVVADVRPELRDDQGGLDAIVALMNSRNVLYTSPKLDISDAVIALLDSKYKRGGPAAAPGAPAASPAPRKSTPAAPRPAPEKP
jgi:Skp family chaperone for outer membrane proteins